MIAMLSDIYLQLREERGEGRILKINWQTFSIKMSSSMMTAEDEVENKRALMEKKK
ncbi:MULTISPECIES: hypothetical protein [unclassified Cedecea]|uniref:hypothetical protein n=1 Tax=unclassified Cedecea TaxID=2649846 RepID=UPI0030175EDE